MKTFLRRLAAIVMIWVAPAYMIWAFPDPTPLMKLFGIIIILGASLLSYGTILMGEENGPKTR